MSYAKRSDLWGFDRDWDDTLEESSKPNSLPLLELTRGDKIYYKHSKRVRGIRYDGLDFVPLNPKLDPPPHRCFSCWERGHLSRTCMNPLISLFCRNCGRRDVDLEDCPRCSRAHRRESAKKDTAEALQEAKIKTEAKIPEKKSRAAAETLLDVSLLVNEGSVASDEDDAPRRSLETIQEEFEFDFTHDMISDVKILMEAVKHLSVKTQDRVLRQWLTERQKNF
ncbi:hypothetical protein TSAR_015168 [Trichomalopsis sarcophagae]|uniref:CCHC-type domain-containing protein n=1 Tax=Trichomalopsis sarcophagae TaxID=543379 RepID=A0A232FES8_9HYME|nr:hypothetical protein TSAR_015168 [Trichomalopsis sarcophagae]